MMANGLSATVDSRIMTFNSLALQTQDEAYTLAYYLLGDDRHAERATQAAFDELFQRARLQAGQFRYEILRRVLDCTQRMMRIMPNRGIPPTALRPKAAPDATFEKLAALDFSQRSVVVLVDVLGLTYEEAAQVLGSSKKQVSITLSQARLNLSEQGSAQQVPPLALN